MSRKTAMTWFMVLTLFMFLAGVSVAQQSQPSQSQERQAYGTQDQTSQDRQTSGRQTTGRTDKDIFAALKDDQKNVSQMIKDLKSGKNGNTLPRVDQALKMHMAFEEKNIYPLLDKSNDWRYMGIQAKDEHEMIRKVASELSQARSNNDEWRAKINELQELVDRHVKNEEDRNMLFAQAKKMISNDQAKALGAQYAQMQSQGQQQMSQRGQMQQQSRATQSQQNQ